MPQAKIIVAICFLITASLILTSCGQEFPPSGDNKTIKESVEVPWHENVLVQPLPPHASSVRLDLPVPLESIVLGPTDHFQGFGAHVGDRSEGVEVVALTIKPGTVISSLAAGEVVEVTAGNDYMGCQVEIDFGDGLSGRHHFLKECLVSEGENIVASQPLGEGNAIGSSYPTVEFLLKDANRSDGAASEFGAGSAVSMFDYLNEADQQTFIDRFQEEIIEPYIAQGQGAGGVTLWEPWLTNKVLLHEDNEGKLTGEWLLTEPWGKDDKPDVMSFLDVSNKYWTGTHMRAINAYDFNAVFSGEWEVDYDNQQVKITGDQGIIYGIFAIDESGELATLKFEYQTEGYPEAFSDQVIEYVERGPVNMYTQAREMGVLSF
ncbi:peptidoglycan DD-metalloendopeptidase family protein [Patescibacteria group bacterium]